MPSTPSRSRSAGFVAAERVIRDESALIRSVAQRLGLGPHDVDEVVQLVALDLMQHPESKRREVFIRHGVAGEPMTKVAASLGVPLRTGYNLLRLARRDLRAALARRALVEERKSRSRAFVFWPWWLSWQEIKERARRVLAALSRAVRPSGAFLVAGLCLVCASARRSGTSSSSEGPLSVATGVVVAPGKLEAAAPGTSSNSDVPPLNNMASAAAEPARAARPRVAVGPGSSKSLPSASPKDGAPSRRGSPVAGKRDLTAARALIDRAQRAAVSGQWEAARAALRQYDVEAPDNPFAVVRSATVRALESR